MKFVVHASSCIRRGTLSEFKRLPLVSVETPACMLFTRCGSVPHLSLDVLSKIENLPSMVAMSMSTLSAYQDVMREGGGLAQFTSVKNKVIFLASHDVSSEVTKFNVTTKKMMVVRNRGGHKLLSPLDFVQVQEVMQADVVQVLGDYEANEMNVTASTRMRKAYERTVDFLNKVVDQTKGTQIEDTPLIASVEGGLQLEARTRCARDSSLQPAVSGFSLEGFHCYGEESEVFWDNEQHMRVLKDTIACLPDDKLRVLGGSLHPLTVISLVRQGVDLFDTSYTYQVTQRGGALFFPYHESHPILQADRMFELNLHERKYADQFIPLVAGCTCHTCNQFSRGYLHHLLNTREMLASVLLSIHNLHHYLRFFENIREAIGKGEDALDEMEARIKQCKGDGFVYKKSVAASDTLLDNSQNNTVA